MSQVKIMKDVFMSTPLYEIFEVLYENGHNFCAETDECLNCKNHWDVLRFNIVAVNEPILTCDEYLIKNLLE